MPNQLPAVYLGRLFRRLAVDGRRAMSSAVRLGQHWTSSGWQLGRQAQVERALRQLALLVTGFRRRGLCEQPGFDRGADFSSLDELAQLPILTRAGAIQLYERLQPLYAARRDMYSRGTGGWTGEPVHYFRSRRLDRICYGMRLEMQSLMGWRPGMACLCLWANPHELGLHARHRSRLAEAMRMVMKHGRYAPTEDDLLGFLEAVGSEPRCAVYGSPGLLLECAQFMRSRGICFAPGHVCAAWSTAEAKDARLPALFKAQFNAPLRDFYGSRETSSISAECQHGQQHINTRYIVEICDGQTGEVLPEEQPGSILITDLFNDVTPFIRYQLGDYGAIKWHECECGRRSFVFTRLIGRPPQLIQLASGRKLTPYCFLSLAQSFPELQRVQLVRHGPREFEYRYTGRKLSSEKQVRLEQLACALAEDAAVRVVRVNDIEKTPSGKQYYYIDRSNDRQSA